MKPLKACALLLPLFALAVVALGDESWRNKPPSEWNEKEVRRILENSPWAHRVKLMLVKPDPQQTACTSGSRRCKSEGDPTAPSGYPGRRRPATIDDAQAQQDKRASSAASPGLDGVAAIAVVRWASSRTVREAVARNGVLRGTVKPGQTPDSSRFAPLGAYVVYVDLRVALADVQRVPQSGVFTTAMAQNSVLVLKSTGERLSPVSVQQALLPEFDERKEIALGAYYILFPRQIDGKPTLPGSDVTLRFECPTLSVSITSEFDLHKMSREGSPDL